MGDLLALKGGLPWQGCRGQIVSVSFVLSHPPSPNKSSLRCQAVAIFHSLADTERDLDTYSSTSVRRGISATLTREVRDLVSNTHGARGRAPNSLIDFTVYTPDSVLTEPGPLFGNVQEIEAKFNAYMKACFDCIKEQLLCRVCGTSHSSDHEKLPHGLICNATY